MPTPLEIYLYVCGVQTLVSVSNLNTITAYSPVARRLYAVQADPEPMSARLVRGGLALACIPNA